MPQGLPEMWAINFPFVRNVVTYEQVAIQSWRRKSLKHKSILF